MSGFEMNVLLKFRAKKKFARQCFTVSRVPNLYIKINDFFLTMLYRSWADPKKCTTQIFRQIVLETNKMGLIDQYCKFPTLVL